MTLASNHAEERLQIIRQEAESDMRSVLGAELERLTSLKTVNQSIRQDELDYLAFCIEESAIHITHANLQLEALRLIITT
jgi:ATP-dependent helicase HepA